MDTANDPQAARSALYRNLGGGKFEDVTDKAGVGPSRAGAWASAPRTWTATAGTDLYVTALGRNRLYRNNRDGTFTDIAEKAGVTGGGWSAGCGFADYDRDGDLDLFVSRYVKIDLDEPARVRQGQDLRVPRHRRAVRARAGLPGEGDFLFRNDGRRHASRRSARRPGVADPRALLRPGHRLVRPRTTTAGPTSTWPTTPTPNFLYLNQKDGTFKESGLPHGRGGQRGRRRAGQHGRGRRATTTTAGASASS